MRSGVPWIPPPPKKGEALPYVSSACGFRVLYDPLCYTVAEARGVGWWRYIAVGTPWFWIPLKEQLAIVHHEAAHLLRRHRIKRWAILPVFWTAYASRVARSQELEADAFAAECGFGQGMIDFVRRMNQGASDYYPDATERLEKLEGVT